MDVPSGLDSNRCRILVVDDEPMNLDLLERSLRRKYHIIPATSSTRGIEVLRADAQKPEDQKIALIISDYRMPDISGTELLAEATKTHPFSKRILITAYGDAEILLQAINRGQVHHVLRKPWKLDQLTQTVDQLIGTFQMERRARQQLTQLREPEREHRERHSSHSEVGDRDTLSATRELERINRELEVLTYRDPLTGLYNHRAFQERLNEEHARARRYNQCLTLIYGDIDHFAEMNRDLGYQMGDEILRRVAALMISQDSEYRVRASDIVARYGGEEFVILLPETDREGGRIKAERLQTAISASNFPGGVRITMSFGVASFPQDATRPEQLIAFAERAQRIAKKAGRNQVYLHEDEMHSSSGIEQAVYDYVDAPSTLTPEARFRTYFEQMGQIVALLRRERAVSCLFIDLTSLRRIEVEFGVATHAEIFSMAGVILRQMRSELFGPDSLICRTPEDDAFLCVMEPSREKALAKPMTLEAIAAQVEKRLNRALAPGVHELVRDYPRVYVGYSRVLNNSMVRSERLVARLVAESRESAELQKQRADQQNKTLLQDIILNERSFPVYQPIVHLETGSIFGFEALTRGPKGTPLEAPATLFSVADEVDLTFELDRACLRRCIQGAAGLEPVHRLFVNLLPLSFYDSAFIEHEVCSLLDASQLTPANIVFEITEKLAIENFASFRSALSRYIDMGFGVAIDDVGTRHSNLESVMALHPNFIKVSDVLSRGAARSTVKREMLRSLRRIAQAIDAVVVAEGIETPDDLVVLHDLGIRYGQGYFLAMPGQAFPHLEEGVSRAIVALSAARRGEPPRSRAVEYDEHGEPEEPADYSRTRVDELLRVMARSVSEPAPTSERKEPEPPRAVAKPDKRAPIDEFDEATRPRFELEASWQPLSAEQLEADLDADGKLIESIREALENDDIDAAAEPEAPTRLLN